MLMMVRNTPREATMAKRLIMMVVVLGLLGQ